MGSRQLPGLVPAHDGSALGQSTGIPVSVPCLRAESHGCPLGIFPGGAALGAAMALNLASGERGLLWVDPS